MAQISKATASKPEVNRIMSHGRGGAGNLNAMPPASKDRADFTTPTIKSQTYTTGRGGQGNMAVNDLQNPAVARAAQDVDAPAALQKDMAGTHHWGRGGEGNMMKIGESERRTSGRRTSSFGAGALEKAKEMLGMGKKPAAAGKESENAID